MSLDTVIAALALPAQARVDQRVPKKLLVEQGAPTAADKRQIQDGIEDLFWVAALKPSTIGVPDFRDAQREYLEIAVLTATLRPKAKAARLTEIIHRAVPYPVFLAVDDGAAITLSLAHKRFSQGQDGKVVAEELHATPPFRLNEPSPPLAAFLSSLALASLPTGDLAALYQGWIDRVTALEAAGITGAFSLPESVEQASLRHDHLEAHARLARDLVALRARAKKEKQISRLVDLNLEIRRLETEQADLGRKIGVGRKA